MTENGESDKGPLRVGAYVVGGLSYIPLVGVIFGVSSIIWGLTTKRAGGKKLSWIGLGGIVFTIVLYGSLAYFGSMKDGPWGSLRKRMAVDGVSSLIQSIEYYKVRHGSYPESLESLGAGLPRGSLFMVVDPMAADREGNQRLFYYELVDEGHYHLFGVGYDGAPYTNDDILPDADLIGAGGVGLMPR